MDSSTKKTRNEIPDELSEFAYEVAKTVFSGELDKSQGIKQISEQGMNRNSARDYIVNFDCMMNGEKYERTNNAFTAEFFLTNIYKDYGVAALTNALKALQIHIDYYEALSITKKGKKGNMRKMRTIYVNFSAFLIKVSKK